MILEDRTLPCHLMTPYNTKRDVYTDEGDKLSEITGLRRISPHQVGRWWVEPHYGREAKPIYIGRDGTVYASNGTVFQGSRGCRLSVKEQIEKTMASKTWPVQVEYLHALQFPEIGREILTTVVEGHNMTITHPTYSILVIDMIARSMSYEERRSILEGHFNLLGIKHAPSPAVAHLVPRFTEDEADTLWGVLHLKNQDFGDKPLYNGLIYKKGNSPYRFQTANTYQSSVLWMYHPFTYYS